MLLKISYFRLQPWAAAAALGALLAGCAARQEARMYRMGERADVGDFVYNVLEAEWRDQMGEGPSARLPQNKFLLLRLSITNSGSADVAAPGLTLASAGGTQYRELAEGEGVPQWLGVIRKLHPAETLQGWVLFDVPKGDYKLLVTDDTFDPDQQKSAWIEVPLRFGNRATER